ncbi:MAG: tetratricopeptide repeat protein [Lachnospiraceae bacterium]|nr:tetratricopeptide repeat protein [Lachnospiraceae bacterium]
MRASICVGEYSTTPYFIAGLEIPVYCMEELCYCIKENAFLMDTGIMNDGLVDWIGSKCGLKELAKQLHPLVHRKGSLSVFVSMIMEYTGLYETAVIRNVEQVLKQGAGLSGIEKRKSQIDYLVGRKKYLSALNGYDALLSKWREMEQEGKPLPAVGVLSAIWHNKGVALAGMMNYERAAECFYKAYELEQNAEYYVAFLAAKRMSLSDEEYISFVADRSEGYEHTLQLEKTMEQLQKSWEEQADYQRLKERSKWRFGLEKQRYYNENDRLTEAFKECYREYVSE